MWIRINTGQNNLNTFNDQIRIAKVTMSEIVTQVISADKIRTGMCTVFKKPWQVVKWGKNAYRNNVSPRCYLVFQSEERIAYSNVSEIDVRSQN